MKRQPCDECGEKTSVQLNDGWTYCHACQHKTSSKSLIALPQTITRCLSLPENLNTEWPREAIDWLSKYDHGIEGLGQHCFWDSQIYSRLCFPYYIQNNTREMEYRGCWMRLVDQTNRPEYKPKWLFAGIRDFVWQYLRVIGSNETEEAQWRLDHTVVLVEDVVSALRVSEHMNCICLGGTNLTDFVKEFIIGSYENVIVFLDGDDAGRNAAEKIRKELKLYCNVRVIRAKRDPKEMSNLQLKRWLYGKE